MQSNAAGGKSCKPCLQNEVEEGESCIMSSNAERD